jgi:hypothetical protein
MTEEQQVLGPPFKWKTWNCTPVVSKYENNKRTALVLLTAEHGDMVTVASINLEGIKIDSQNIILKTWGENIGLVDVLIEQKLIAPKVLDRIPTGFVIATLYAKGKALLDLEVKTFGERNHV